MKKPPNGGLFILGRLTGLEPATPGIRRKVSKLGERVSMRVCGVSLEATPHIHHTLVVPPMKWETLMDPLGFML